MNTITNRYYLEPIDGRKSFYGKALVIGFSDGARLCRSYDTDVAYITPSGEFRRLWDDYSATTMRHINSFRYHYVWASCHA